MLEAEVDASSTTLGKASKGKTSAEVRDYEQAEFDKLFNEKKDKLIEIRKRRRNRKDSGNYKNNTIF